MAEKEAKKSHYDASDITVLEGFEAVRRRPGMYIGTTGPDGLHHLIWEIFDNSRDEAMGGFADDIEVALLPGNRVRVADNGRGIPVDIHKNKSFGAGNSHDHPPCRRKIRRRGIQSFRRLHGVGASVVNAFLIYCNARCTAMAAFTCRNTRTAASQPARSKKSAHQAQWHDRDL